MAPYSSADCGFLLVGPYDICTVTGEIEDNTDDTPVEKTMFGTNAATFLPAVVRKYALSQTGLYDDSAGSIDDAMVALRASQNVLLLGYEGNVLGRHARAVGAALRASYARTGFAVGDYVGTKADITANGVAEDALIVAPLAAVVASGNSEAGYLDLGAPAAAGCSVYVVCTHLSGMDYLDVSLMHSADHVAWVTVSVAP